MSWVPGAGDSPFNIHHLPYGIFSTKDDPSPRPGIRISDQVLDLRATAAGGSCPGCPTCSALSATTLNPLMALGHEVWAQVRSSVQTGLTENEHAAGMSAFLTPVREVRMHMPFDAADFVDFYASEHHATTMGKMLRPNGDALLPNWKHLPVGYHGRAGTLTVSGEEIARPCGQRRAGEAGGEYGPTGRLDIEAEVGFVVGQPSNSGTPVSPDAFTEHVFGVVLVNDWSARDFQGWEGQPLGPFLAKSFATSISAWVTPLDALAAARVPAPEQDPAVLPYLKESDRYAYDLRLGVELNGQELTRPPFKDMYWTPAQQLAHLTANGAQLRTGDLFASGTVSGPRPDEVGCLMELTQGGNEPLTLADGSIRTFLVDGDKVTISAQAPGPRGTTIGLGEVTATIAPTRN